MMGFDVASASVRPEPWQDIATAPRTGIRIEVGHSKAPGYVGTGSWVGYRWSCSIAFVEPGRRPLLHWQPDIWRPTAEQARTLADAHSKSPSRPAMPKEEDTHGS